MTAHPHSILVIDAVGFWRSLALLPAMRALRAAYPRTFITAAVTKGACEILTACGLADETIDLGVINDTSGIGGAIKRFALIAKRARQRQFDLALDFAPGTETQLVSRVVLGARTVSPSKMPHMLDKLLGRIGIVPPPGDEMTDCANVLGQMGIRLTDKRLGLEIPDEENAQFEKLLAKNGSRGGEPLAVLHSSLLGGSRGWPVAHFIETATRLSNNLETRIIAIDQPYASHFTDATGSALPRGAIKLKSPRAYEMLAAIARASLVITDEPGLAGAALDLGTPVLEVAEKSVSSDVSFHRAVYGASRARIPVEDVYTAACEMIQESRSSILFQR